MDDRDFAPDSLLVHAGFVRRIARALVRDEHAAEDVVQETWAAALSSPPKRGGPLGPWLTTLARNFGRQIWRRDQRRSERERTAANAEAVPSAASICEREESLRAVVEAVLSLAEPYRSTIIQRFYEDLPPRAIAARGRVPVETVHTRLRRALVQLRETLGGQGRQRDWRSALLVYAGGEVAPAANASAAATLLLWPTLLLMKTKTFLAAALLLGLPLGLYALVDGRGEQQPAEASQSLAPALVSESTSRRTESADSGPVDPVRRVAVSGPQPRTEAAAVEDPDSLPEWFDVAIRVLDASGKAVPDARVELWEMPGTLPIREFARKGKGWGDRRADTKAPLLRATTGASGRCTLRIDREPLMAHAERPDLGASGDEAWTHHRLRVNQEFTLTLEPLVQVSVLVLRADGLPAAGVMVEVGLLGGRDHENPVIPPPERTDLEGRCRFALNPGYTFGLWAREGTAQAIPGKARTKMGSGPLEVVLRFPGALSLAGILRTADGTPAAGTIALWEQRTQVQRKEDVFGGFHRTQEIGERGEFQIDVPYEGRFELIGTATGHANSETVTLEVNQAQPHPFGDVWLTRPASLAGVVVRENGVPVAGAHLSATVSNEGSGWTGAWSEIGPPDLFGKGSRAARSDEHGAFRIEGLHPRARYTLVCIPDPKRSAVHLTQKHVVAGGADLRLVITADQLKTGRIVGTVIAASTGKPITRFQQWSVQYADGKGFVPSTELDVQDEQGAFRSGELGFGQTRALAIACDDYAPALAGPVTISQEEHRFEVRLPDFGTVAVRVLDADGTPAANVELFLRTLDIVPRNRGWSPQRSGDNGAFLWEKVPPGRYRLIAQRDPKHPEQKECEVHSAQKTDVEIRLPR